MTRFFPSIRPDVVHLVGPGKLAVKGRQLTFAAAGGAVTRVVLGGVQVIVCHGAITMTAPAIDLLMRNGIEVSMLTTHGTRFRGRMVGRARAPVTLRVAQHRLASDRWAALELAQGFVVGKIDSQVDAARHFQRQGTIATGPTITGLKTRRHRARTATSVDQLSGHEGVASRLWFGLFGHLLPVGWSFEGRSRRPPRDPVNALLSLGYTWLLARVLAAVEAVGLEPEVGFLHSLHSGRPSLACDMMEPYRVPFVDRWVLAMCHRRQIRPDGFEPAGNGWRLRKGSYGRMLSSWERRNASLRFDERLEADLSALCTRLRDKPRGSRDGEVQATS